MPNDVDAAIADIAFVFHWALADLNKLDLEEVAIWREKAIERWNSTNTAGED